LQGVAVAVSERPWNFHEKKLEMDDKEMKENTESKMEYAEEAGEWMTNMKGKKKRWQKGRNEDGQRWMKRCELKSRDDMEGKW
jgi:hypothetical protein